MGDVLAWVAWVAACLRMRRASVGYVGNVDDVPAWVTWVVCQRE